MRPRMTWMVFVACLAVLLAAMGWTTRTVVRLDRAQAEARRQADFEQTVRLALWRMESALSPLIAQESSYPYFAYASFSPLSRVYTRGLTEFRGGEVLIPSPLMAQTHPQVVIHFQFDADGTLTSPEVPTGAMLELAVKQGYGSDAEFKASGEKLAELRRVVAYGRLGRQLPAPQASLPIVVTAPPANPSIAQSSGKIKGSLGQQDAQQAEQVFAVDNRLRVMQQQRAQDAALQNISSNGMVAPPQPRGPVQAANADPGITIGLMQPIWADGTLLLARRVAMNNREYVQGSQLDWHSIRKSLLADIADLLPSAALEPDGTSTIATRPALSDYLRLAALPVRVVPGEAASGPVKLTPGLAYSLLIAWAGVLLATLAAVALLKGALALSERRAAFVSAVTHELRTPLTTFKLYTEMLEENRVAGEERRRQYLGTLRTQADRLCHLVENVLAYARLERGRKCRQCEAVAIEQLLGQMGPRLGERASQAGMNLRLRSVGPARSDAARVLADPSALEQILMNLVDNACKYAAAAANRDIEIGAISDGSRVTIRVRDHGPGILAGERRKVFRPFHKSAHQAANSAPGVGLGLGLSRRLAREMGGDLRIDAGVTDGACFVLSLRAG